MKAEKSTSFYIDRVLNTTRIHVAEHQASLAELECEIQVVEWDIAKAQERLVKLNKMRDLYV